MLDEIGGFDEDFFLYCEDTDLGLRARWAGWKCWYAPKAIVYHHYSHTAGRATPLKAFYVERNRLFLLVKNFPLSKLILAPFGIHIPNIFNLGVILGTLALSMVLSNIYKPPSSQVQV